MSSTDKIYPVNLKCEYRTNPVGVDEKKPRLSWAIDSRLPGLTQTAYRIQAAGRIELLLRDQPDLWDSGKVISDRSIHVEYEGSTLHSLQECFWRVKVWCRKSGEAEEKAGNAAAAAGDEIGSLWSGAGSWSMGLLEERDWQGFWVSGEYRDLSGPRIFFDNADPSAVAETPENGTDENIQGDQAFIYRKEAVIAKSVKKATALICGLGYYQLFINGEKTGDHVLDPVFTDYSKRVCYVAYDVTSGLREGKNCFGVILGNGFYNANTRDLFQFEKAHWRTSPKFILNIFIQLQDGTTEVVKSDGTWKWSAGEIVYNSIRGGETIDCRLMKKGWDHIGYDDSSWHAVNIVAAPAGKLVSQYVYPMRVVEAIPPVSLAEPVKNIFVFDFGRNLTGWVRLKAQGKPGQKLTIRFNEKLKNDGLLDTEYSASHTYGRFQKGELILSGDGEALFEPRFTYHGFRYVQIEGLSGKPEPGCISACSVHTDLPAAGGFSCSNEKLNQLHQAARRTLLDCIHGMPGEEPTREKMGWNQDAQNTAEAYMYNFDSATAYIKYIRDIIDSQESGGHIPPIIPTNGWGLLKPDGNPIRYDDPWWGASLAVIVNRVYEYYSDINIIKESYPSMKKYVDFLSGTARNFILEWSLGDWLDLTFNEEGPGLTPVALTSTAGYYHVSRLLSDNARLLGEIKDAEYYGGLAENIRDAFNRNFLDSEAGVYREGSQTAQALPLFLGMVPEDCREKVLSRLLMEIEKSEDHITTGFIGAMPLISFLSEAGLVDLAYRMVTQESGTGWMYMVKGENSTLGENLNPEGYGTGHHPFAACISAWFYKYLAGIRTDVSSPGFKKIVIKPEIPEGLEWVRGEYDTIHGRIACQWEKRGDVLRMRVEIPANTSALVYVPGKSADTVEAWRDSEQCREPVKYLRQESDRMVFSAGSGDYSFVSGIHEVKFY